MLVDHVCLAHTIYSHRLRVFRFFFQTVYQFCFLKRISWLHDRFVCDLLHGEHGDDIAFRFSQRLLGLHGGDNNRNYHNRNKNATILTKDSFQIKHTKHMFWRHNNTVDVQKRKCIAAFLMQYAICNMIYLDSSF